LITISPEDPIGKAMEIMASKNVRRIYVVKEGKIIGRVTQTVAFKHLTNVLIALHEMMADL
jgi:predicted transcriptional regulator